MEKPVSLLTVGCGMRGLGYSAYAFRNPEKAKIVGFAEPRKNWQDRMLAEHDVSSENVYADWRDMTKRDKFADAVIIATQDSEHVEPAIAFAKKGYHILLEKPMATSEDDCRRIVKAVNDNRVILAVCHVLRHTYYTRKIKELVESGVIGDIVSIQHLEQVGYWHQAHSFVRGPWRNEAESTFMLMAKSCHDVDWIRHIMGQEIKRVSSFGSLFHFRKENKPAGAADRCLDCPQEVESNCPYSAKKIYLKRVAEGATGWPLLPLTTDVTVEGVTKALREGPYGRCVYACDNDVVDHQVVNLEFEGGRTASFVMTAFNKDSGFRKSTIFGTRGELICDGSKIVHNDFLTEKTVEYDTNITDATLAGGHGGGDARLMDTFVQAVADNDPSSILSGAEVTLETHLAVFAAERARLNGSVETVNL